MQIRDWLGVVRMGFIFLSAAAEPSELGRERL